jgi:acetyltransferase-like isoleucine patch superfamily enzyme
MKWLEKIIRLRNPQFSFDRNVDARIFMTFLFTQLINYTRSFRLLLYLRHPKSMLMASGVRLFYIHKIRFGRFLKLGKHVELSALGKEGITLGNNVSIGSFSRVIVSTTLSDIGLFIRIGNNVGIGEFAYLGGAGGLEIGEECIIGQYFSCHPENHNFADTENAIRHQGVSRKGIKIGANCWIGSKVTLLDGCEIGEGCVIAAGSVVNKSFPSKSIIGGVPARIIKMRNEQ